MDPAPDKIDDTLLDEIIDALGPAADLSSSQCRVLIGRILNGYGAREDPRRKFAYDLANAVFQYHLSSELKPVVVHPTNRGDKAIGEGTFAEAFMAKLNGEKVVLKVIKSECNKMYWRMVRNEIVMWKKIPAHENLLPFWGVSIDIDRNECCVRYSLVSPYAGMDLQAVGIKSKPFSEARDIFLKVARALVHLHDREPPIIHGDIRPANILVNGQHIVLADFGLSKFYTTDPSPFTMSPARKELSLPWLAPELQDHTVSRTKATDIFSFASTVLQAYGQDIQQCEDLKERCWVSPFPPYRPDSGLSEELAIEVSEAQEKFWSLLLSCLSLKPGDRKTASELVRGIEELPQCDVDRTASFFSGMDDDLPSPFLTTLD